MAKGKLGGKKPKVSKSKLKDTKLIIALCAVLAVIVFFAVLFLLQRVVQTETYYVLNEDLGPRMQVNAEHLDPIITSEGSAPPNALSLADIQMGGVYTQYPLRSGDIITESSVGALSDISVGIPDEWVVTSFAVSADNAVGGRVQRGTYFDIIGINSDNEAFYVFSNVLALDTTVSMTGASSADAVDSEEASSGMTEQYYIGLSPENAALLHSAVREYDIRLVLSPRQNEYEEPQVERMQGYFYYDPSQVQEVPVVGGEGITDETFTPREREVDGRPAAGAENETPSPDDVNSEDWDEFGGPGATEGEGEPSEAMEGESNPEEETFND